jgi:hypothetical protein
MMYGLIGFAIALLGLVGLFSLKYAEVRRGARYAPRVRERADSAALRLKSALFESRTTFVRLAPEVVHVVRMMVREVALGLASLARSVERGAHALADMVSHKHRFERKEPKNEFLKKVEEVKERTEYEPHVK